MSNSAQHYIGRNRPPRVQITYDVELGDAVRKYELKFLVGILSDLYGEPHRVRAEQLEELLKQRRAELVKRESEGKQPSEEELAKLEAEAERLIPARHLDDERPIKDRKFIDIDKENFDQVLERILPCCKVGGTTLVFTKMEDFDPHSIVAQHAKLEELQKARDRLRDLSGALDGNDDLYAQVMAIIETLPADLRAALESKDEADDPADPPADNPEDAPADGE